MAHDALGLKVSNGLSVPDFFADDAVGFENINGTVRIRFGVTTPAEPVPPSDIEIEITGRLIMPTVGAQRLCLALYDFLKNQGLDPSDLVSEGKEAN